MGEAGTAREKGWKVKSEKYFDCEVKPNLIGSKTSPHRGWVTTSWCRIKKS